MAIFTQEEKLLLARVRSRMLSGFVRDDDGTWRWSSKAVTGRYVSRYICDNVSDLATDDEVAKSVKEKIRDLIGPTGDEWFGRSFEVWLNHRGINTEGKLVEVQATRIRWLEWMITEG